MSRLSVFKASLLRSLPWLPVFAAFSVDAAGPDLTDTVPRVLPAVVHIAIGDPRPARDPSLGDSAGAEALVAPAHRGQRVAGSGVIIAEDGHILTVAYLFDTADRILVRLNDGREFPARLVGRDRRSNIALIKIDAPGLSAARIGDPRKIRLAERVFAVGGLPSGLSATVTDGIVSVISGRQEGLAAFIQTTAPLYPAMGGGPLCSQNGEVIGINSMVYSRSTGVGLSFAVPIDDAMRVASELRAAGRVQRGTLGLVIQEMTADLAEAFALPKSTGVLVHSVQKEMPAAKAGIGPGDVIVRIGNETVNSPANLVRLVASLKPGTSVSVEILRVKGRRSETLELVVGDASD